jgi:serine/threonine protein kinase
MATYAVPPDWQVGLMIYNRYEVKGLLGEGGMGRVYLVYDHAAQSKLVIKRPRPEIFVRDGGKEAFIREAETWVGLKKVLSTIHIAQCHTVFTIEGVPCILAEYVAGGSLAEWIEGEEHLLYRGGSTAALARILDVAIQMAWGLQGAHGLVHRDVKPANVLLTPEGIAKITDFGLAQARFLAGETTRSGRADTSVIKPGVGLMTRAYASPEQAEGKPLTQHTDMWSWAVSVLDMFVGAVGRGYGPAAAESLEDYLSDGPTNPAIPWMPPGVVTLLRQCFQPDPAARPGNLWEVAEGLTTIYMEEVGSSYPRPGSILLTVSPKEDPYPRFFARFFDKAGALLHLGKPEEALAACEQALHFGPKYADVWVMKGDILGRLQRDEEALAAYEQALSLDPQHAAAWTTKGSTLLRLKQPEEALIAFRQALLLDPALVSIIVTALRAQGLVAEAREIEAWVRARS